MAGAPSCRVWAWCPLYSALSHSVFTGQAPVDTPIHAGTHGNRSKAQAHSQVAQQVAYIFAKNLRKNYSVFIQPKINERSASCNNFQVFVLF